MLFFINHNSIFVTYSYIAIPQIYYSLNGPTHKLDFTSE